MHGYGPKLPLLSTPEDGKYGLTKTINENVAQNIKHLVLTCPGERIMDPEFGVGLKKYLFDMNDRTTADAIAASISTQVQIYMPNIVINNIDFAYPRDDDGRSSDFYPESDINKNLLGITLSYSIKGGGNISKNVYIPMVGNATTSGY
tara:strand:- start:507 stop:950 length:444 start_codon:yes stop_codon:yes gene_type:complete